MGSMGNQMGVRAVISSLFLKEPVTIQYRGNRKKITSHQDGHGETLYPWRCRSDQVVFSCSRPSLIVSLRHFELDGGENGDDEGQNHADGTGIARSLSRYAVS